MKWKKHYDKDEQQWTFQSGNYLIEKWFPDMISRAVWTTFFKGKPTSDFPTLKQAKMFCESEQEMISLFKEAATTFETDGTCRGLDGKIKNPKEWTTYQ